MKEEVPIDCALDLSSGISIARWFDNKQVRLA